MNEKNKRGIMTVYEMLCLRDPAWRQSRMVHKFKVLYQAWRTVELRHKKHSAVFYTDSWRRGWMPLSDFERFRRYAMQ